LHHPVQTKKDGVELIAHVKKIRHQKVLLNASG
jgi:hypothetical protein